MKKVNFNQLKSVKTPENWIENAIKIPQKNKKKPIYINPYIIASAACFIFCCTLCAVVFANFGVDMPNPIAPVKPSSTSVSDVADGTTPSSNPSLIPTIPNPITEIIPTFSTQQQTGSGQKSTNPTATKNGTVQGSTSKSSSNSQSVVTKPEPSETGGGSNNNSGSTDRPTNPDTPVAVPTQPVTDPPESPTNTPTPTEPETPLIPETTAAGASGSFNSSIYFYWSPDVCGLFDEENYRVYCHIMTAAGQTFTEKFSWAERATYDYSLGEIIVQYNPLEKGLHLNPGNYYLTFYDNCGHSYTYSAYLGDQPVIIYI